MTTSTPPKPLVIKIDKTGDYDFFLKSLETRLPRRAKKGDVFFILHADKDKELYVPRSKTKAHYDIYVNPAKFKDVEKQDCPAHQQIAMLLRTRTKTDGYYVIWESSDVINLIPASGKAKPSKGFA